MRLKLIRWLFIPFACIVLMSHNSFAVDVSLNAVPIWTNYDATLCVDVISVGTTCNSNGYLNTTSSATQSIGSLSFSLPVGLNITSGKTVAVYETVLDNFQDNNSIDSVFLNPRVRDAGPVNWGLLSVRSFSQGSGSYRVEFTFLAEGTGTVPSNNRYIAISTNYNNAELAFLKPGERISGGMASYYYLEGSGTDAIINAINNNNSSSVIQQQGEAIVEAIEEAQSKEDQAVDNISNQTPPASGSGENTQTTSLLNTLGSFLSAITNLSATDCNVVLAFPSFAGGSQTVNICQNKEYTGNIVSIAGSIILVMFYLPVAFMLVSKIYSEIRSFTNG